MLKGMHLSLLMGPVAFAPVPKMVIDALSSVSVTQSATGRSGFQLTFSLDKGSEIARRLLPIGFFDPLIRVVLVATVNGNANVLIDGLIARQDVAPSNAPGGSTLTVTGEDVSLAMDLVELTGFKYPCLPAEARVLTILARYAMFGLIPLIIPSPFIDVPVPTDEIPEHAGTDLAYINRLASDTGYVFYVQPGPVPGTNTAYWGPEIRYGAVQPALSVNSDSATNVESLSFGFDGLAGKIPVVVIQEKNSKIPIPIPIPPVGILRPPLAFKPAIPHQIEYLTEEGLSKHGPIRAIAVGLARASQSADAVTGSGSLDVLRYGHVLKPRGLVGVRGAGLSYDGVYYVKSVTHNIKRGEYKQSFSLAREGLVPTTPSVSP